MSYGYYVPDRKRHRSKHRKRCAIVCQREGLPAFDLISQRMKVCLPLDFLKLTSAFAYRKAPVSSCTIFHDGIDLQCDYAHVYAMLPGIIKEVHYGNKGYGNYIVLEHGSLNVCMDTSA